MSKIWGRRTAANMIEGSLQGTAGKAEIGKRRMGRLRVIDALQDRNRRVMLSRRGGALVLASTGRIDSGNARKAVRAK